MSYSTKQNALKFWHHTRPSFFRLISSFSAPMSENKHVIQATMGIEELLISNFDLFCCQKLVSSKFQIRLSGIRAL